MAWAIQKFIFVCPEIGVVEFNIRIVTNVACLCRSKGKQVRPQRFFVRRTIGPECAASRPIDSESFVVGHRVLNDEGLYPFWMCQNDAKAHRPAIVLHIKCVSGQTKRLREIINHARIWSKL